MFTTDPNPNINELKKLMPILPSPRDMQGETIKEFKLLTGMDSDREPIPIIVIVFESGKMYFLPGRLTMPFGVEINWMSLLDRGLIHEKLYKERIDYRRKVLTPTLVRDLILEWGLTVDDMKEALDDMAR